MLAEIKKALEAQDYVRALQLCELPHPLSEDPMCWVYRGAALMHLGRLTEAEAAFEEATRRDPTLVAPYKNLAQIRMARKDPRACEDLILSTWLDPADPKPFQDLHQLAPELFKFPDVDIVFYTGTPWLNLNFVPGDLDSRPLGGSETALIAMARELARRGRRVACFCNTSVIQTYDNVFYAPVSHFFLMARTVKIPILMASRFPYPFQKGLRTDCNLLWLHDVQGSAMNEPLLPLMSHVDLVFVLSDTQAAELMRRHQIPPKKIIKTRNGFLPEYFAQEVPARQREPMSLVYASRPDRGLGEALEVFKILRLSIPQAVLHVCAYTPWNDLEKDRDLAHFMPLLRSPGIIYHGGLSKPELMQLFEKTQLLLYPNVTELETSCMVAIEAMAAGLPVITSDRGALPETLADGVGGRVIAFGNGDEIFIRDLASACLELLTNSTAWETLSRTARKRAWDTYRWEQVAAEWDRLFEQVLPPPLH